MFTFTLNILDGLALIDEHECRADMERDGTVTVEIWDYRKNRWAPCIRFRDDAIAYLDQDETGGWTEYLNDLRIGRKVYDREMHRAAE